MACYRSALKINEEFYAPLPAGIADKSPNLDDTLIRLSHYDNGEEYLKAITTGLVMRGNMLFYNGETKQAIKLYRSALTSIEIFYGTVDPKTSKEIIDIESALIVLASYDNGTEYVKAVTTGLVYKGNILCSQEPDGSPRRPLSSIHRIAARMFVCLRDRFSCMGAYEEARVYAMMLVKMNLVHYGTYHAKTARAMEGFGKLLIKLGKYKAAYKYLTAAQGINAKKEPITASKMENWGYVLAKLYKNLAAEVHLKVALRIKRQKHGRSHPETLRTMGMYGMVLRRLEKPKEAKIYLNMALKVEKKKTSVRENLGMVLIILHKYELDKGGLLMAKKYLKEALDIRQQRYHGKNHPKLGEAMGNYGAVLSKLGMYVEAERYLKKAQQITLNHFGLHHKCARRIENFSMMAICRDYEERFSSLRDVLKINKRVYGIDHLKTAKTMARIGSTLIKLDEYAEAMRLLGKALPIITSILGKGHLRTARVMEDLGRAHVKLGNYGTGANYLRNVLTTYERAYNPYDRYHPQTVRTMMNFWHALERSGNEIDKKLKKDLRKACKKGVNQNYSKASRLEKNLLKVVKKLNKQKAATQY